MIGRFKISELSNDQENMNERKIISRLSFASGLCILAMFLVTVITGKSQEIFEVTQTVEQYSKNLVESQNALRVIFTFDIIFICLFMTLFVFLAQHLKTNGRTGNTIANVAMVALLITGFLDFYEDLHILTMLHAAINDLPIEQTQIASQMLFSMLKFCSSYFGLFLLAFILPSKTFTEKLLKYGLLVFQLPIGALVYTAPENLHLIFNLIRFAFMVSGFFLLAYNFSRSNEE